MRNNKAEKSNRVGTRKYVVSALRKVTNFEQFLAIMRGIAAEHAVSIQGYVIVPGPGCANHGLLLWGDEQECVSLVETLAHMLIGKCSEVSIDDPAVQRGQFEDKMESSNASPI